MPLGLVHNPKTSFFTIYLSGTNDYTNDVSIRGASPGHVPLGHLNLLRLSYLFSNLVRVAGKNSCKAACHSSKTEATGWPVLNTPWVLPSSSRRWKNGGSNVMVAVRRLFLLHFPIENHQTSKRPSNAPVPTVLQSSHLSRPLLRPSAPKRASPQLGWNFGRSWDTPPACKKVKS